MLKPFICGSGNFHQEEEDDHQWVPSSSPKTSRKSMSCRRSNKNKNPYSTCGLDKFEKVLADLDERRQKIYEQMGSQDISLVRFGYSNSNGWVPIVVKLRDKKQYKTKFDDGKDKPVTQNSEDLDKNQIEQAPKSSSDGRMNKKKSFISRSNFFRRMGPSFYLPMFIVLILLCLVMYGRTFAILCTSIAWYLVPMMKARDSNSRRSMKKKEYVRKSSGTNMEIDGFSSPKGEIIRHGSPPTQHGHNKSW